MYESFYGLSSKPFQLNPDPAFYYGSKQHKRASAYLEYGMHQNEGFIVITGDVGAGKTTIVRELLDNLDSGKVVAAHLVSTQLDADDTLRLVASSFGIRTKDVAKSDILLSLEAFLVNATRQNKRCLLIVDEAQNLRPRAVEELRMLSNFQFGNYSLLQTFLIGQPEFRDILQSPEMLQLRQRVIATCHINPLDREETQGYIEHRLKCAGARDGIPDFEASAYDAIFQGSGGVPRRINTICDRVLLSGFLGGILVFSADHVNEVFREMGEESPSKPNAGPQMLRPGRRDDLRLDLDESVLDLDLDRDLDPEFINEATAIMASLDADQMGERLLRLERGMLRLERINSAMLGLMQKLLQATLNAKKDSGE